MISLSFNDIQDSKPPFEDLDGFDDFDHALLASKSEDGGLTWTRPEIVIRDTDANAFNDKQSITADPTDANNIYAVWDRLVFSSSEAAKCASWRNCSDARCTSQTDQDTLSSKTSRSSGTASSSAS